MPLLTRKELAEKLGVAPITIHRWKTKNNLPYVFLATKTIRYDWEQVQEWIKQQEAGATHEQKQK